MSIQFMDFSQDPPVITTMTVAAAADIPDGSVVLYADGTVDGKELTMAALKNFVVTDVVGQLVATATYPVGAYPVSPPSYRPWVLDADAPSSITVESFGTTYTDVILNIGRSKRLSDRHIGWLFQCKLGGVIYQETTQGLYNLGALEIFIEPSAYMTVNAQSEIQVIPYPNSIGEDLIIIYNTSNLITIAADDPVITFEVRMLMS